MSGGAHFTIAVYRPSLRPPGSPFCHGEGAASVALGEAQDTRVQALTSLVQANCSASAVSPPSSPAR